MSHAIVWFRADLRLADNPALAAALEAGHAVIPVYVLDEETAGIRAFGTAARWWLRQSLQALDAALRSRGSRLVLRRGPAEQVIDELVTQCQADAVYWNRLYDPASRDRDARLKQSLLARGVTAHSFKASLLTEPWEARTKAGLPFKVFTPFWRACRAQADPGRPLDAPTRLPRPAGSLAGASIASLLHQETPSDLAAHWTPGEASAVDRLASFLDDDLEAYHRQRDIPAVDATSRLSPHLAFGELSPRQIWRAVTARRPSPGGEKFLAEIGWREFSYNLLFHVGGLDRHSMRAEFDDLPWRDQPELIDAWKHGRTGYPIVDAGMRQLLATGWMHNRVRMITASFLIKHLLVDWRIGERWFWNRLVDADPANNPVGWQWVAGSGADAAPFFRIFNPVLQGEKFDPAGAYVKRWLPELAHLPPNSTHRPWTADPPLSQQRYPQPIVDHASARQRALDAFAGLRRRPLRSP
ncbi:cryptochrome/photolyase family protein [Reyranella sp.]|uniref:cryptochrome/photolyase family protein n=1 Tax=Reyranella sp. TaxID=1929291 RepID=UPI0037836245